MTVYRLITCVVAFGGLFLLVALFVFLGHIAEAMGVGLWAAFGMGVGAGGLWLWLIYLFSNLDHRERLKLQRQYTRMEEAERRARLAERGAFRRG